MLDIPRIVAINRRLNHATTRLTLRRVPCAACDKNASKNQSRFTVRAIRTRLRLALSPPATFVVIVTFIIDVNVEKRKPQARPWRFELNSFLSRLDYVGRVVSVY